MVQDSKGDHNMAVSYFTPIQLAEIEHRVDTGVWAMDEFFPGWADVIYPDRLSMTDDFHCVLGQRFGCFERGVLRMIEALDANTGDEDVYHGFDAFQFGFNINLAALFMVNEYAIEYYTILTALWLKKANEHRNRNATPAS